MSEDGRPAGRMLRRVDRAVAVLGSGTARPLVLVAVVVGSLGALLAVQERFRNVTGLPVLDTQDTVGTASAVAQIRSYDAAARGWYAAFVAVDVVFPVAAALLLAVVARRAVLLGPRRGSGAPLIPPPVALFCLLPAVADLAENAGLVAAVATGGAPGVVAVALAAKAVKLASIPLAGALVLVLAATAAATALVRWRGGTAS